MNRKGLHYRYLWIDCFLRPPCIKDDLSDAASKFHCVKKAFIN